MTTSAQKAEKFLFDTAFDEPEAPAADPTAPEADAGLTNADLEALRADVFEAGRQEGLREAHASIEATASALLERIETQVQTLIDDRRQIETALSGQAAALAHAIAAKLAPALMEKQPLAEIENLTTECLREVHGEPRLVVRLHENLVPALKERVDALSAAAGYEGSVMLLGDDQMGPMDCKVEWANGGAEYRFDALTESAEAAVKRYLDTLSSPAEGESAPHVAESAEAATDATAEPDDMTENSSEAPIPDTDGAATSETPTEDT